MSLLLDALKKAAEKKAKKSAEQAVDDTVALDKTETLAQTDPTAVMATEIDKTQADPTAVMATEIDKTQADPTAVTATEIDQTQAITETRVDATKVDSTRIDATQVDSTQVDSTRIDATQVDSTQVDSTRIDATQVDSTQVDSTQVDSTRIDATQVDSTQVDSTQVDSTRIDATQVGSTQIDSTQLDATGVDSTQIDAARVDTTHLDRTQLNATELDAATTRFDTTEIPIVDVNNLASDDEDTIIGEGEEVQVTDDSKVMDSTQTIAHTDEPASTESLTEDDVTDFMGDGYREVVNSDDTTSTNPESLTLTNFGYSDEDPSLVIQSDATETDTFSLGGSNMPAGDDDTSTASLNMRQLPDDDQSTLLRSDSTSTGSAVDIEKLTSDETVTVEGRTSTRTFAPDNYDRTLINLSDKDVSRIFPGMKTESGAVMTPDYAKKVFISKSGQARAGYYKWYAGMALLLLLGVVLFGMFQLIDESETIDQRLASLKRDPMPGIIKTPEPEPQPVLFDSNKQAADARAAKILAQAEVDTTTGNAQSERAEQPAADKPVSTNVHQQGEVTAEKAQQDVLSASSESLDLTTSGMSDKSAARSASSPASDSQKSHKSTASTSKRTVAAHSQTTATSADKQLVITSNTRPSRKAALLQAAYQAYQNGDMQAAAEHYDQALVLDPVDRDALLGRAAVHIQQNEYQAAIDLYQRVLEQNPQDSIAMTSLISVANIDPQAGESKLKSMLANQPESPYLHFVLGNLYGSQQRWNEAQQAYFDALKLKPGDANYAYNLAVSLDHIGQKAVAAQYYRRALDFSTNSRVNFDTRLAAERLEVLAR